MNSILAVDINAESSEKTAHFLQNCGISTIVTAYSPTEALLILENRRIDCIIAPFDLWRGERHHAPQGRQAIRFRGAVYSLEGAG